MKRLALAAAGAAVVGADGMQPDHCAISGISQPGVVTHSAVAVNCGKLYHAWEQGQGKGLVTTLSAVGLRSAAGDATVLTAALKKAGPAITRAAHYPMPTCADPKGYWGVLLMHVNAAATNTGSMSSVRAAMKGVPKLTHQLIAELKRTTRD